MGSLEFQIKYNESVGLVISPEELIQQYLYGVPICGVQGQELTDGLISSKIVIAQKTVENLLYIKLTEQMIHESQDFNRDHWRGWGYVKTSYPVKFALAMEGYYNNIKQISYPYNWLNSRKEQSSLTGNSESIYLRQIHMIPSGTTGNAESGGITYNGATPFALFQGLHYIPNYWRTTYVTGFDKMPKDILDYVSKLAAIQLLSFLGEIYLGIGMNSYSISLDGLSQSTSLLKSAENGVFGARIKQFMNDMFGQDGKGGTTATLKAKYKGITFDVC